MRGHRDAPPEVLADERAIYQAVGRRLAVIRQQRRLQQAEVAAKVGLTRSSIANIETGRQSISLAMFLKLADAVGVPPPELLR